MKNEKVKAIYEFDSGRIIAILKDEYKIDGSSIIEGDKEYVEELLRSDAGNNSNNKPIYKPKRDELSNRKKKIKRLVETTGEVEQEKPIAWFTMHGKHIPIFKGGRVGNNPLGITHYTPRSVAKGKEVLKQLKETDKETFKAVDSPYQQAWTLKRKLKKETDETKRRELEEKISNLEAIVKERKLTRKEKIANAKELVKNARPKKLEHTARLIKSKKDDVNKQQIEAGVRKIINDVQAQSGHLRLEEWQALRKEKAKELKELLDKAGDGSMVRFGGSYSMYKIGNEWKSGDDVLTEQRLNDFLREGDQLNDVRICNSTEKRDFLDKIKKALPKNDGIELLEENDEILWALHNAYATIGTIDGEFVCEATTESGKQYRFGMVRSFRDMDDCDDFGEPLPIESYFGDDAIKTMSVYRYKEEKVPKLFANKTPATLKHFKDRLAKSIVSQKTIHGFTNAEQKKIENDIANMLDKGAYSMRCDDDVLDLIAETHFKNQFEVGESGGCFNPARRRRIANIMYGTSRTGIADVAREKYGYLGNADYSKDNIATWYGNVIVHFKKDRIKDVTTYTFGDSLDQRDYLTTAGISSMPSIAGLPIYKSKEKIAKVLSESSANPQRVAGDLGLPYIELQYHTDNLTIDDVESVCYPQGINTKHKEKTINLLRQKGAKIFQKQSDGTVKEI